MKLPEATIPADDLHALIQAAVGHILRTEDAAQFMGWMRDDAIGQYPALFDQFNDEGARLLFAFLLGRSIWNATPLPGNRFTPAPLPSLDPQALCPCDSGRDYQHCCMSLPAPDFPLKEEDLLFWVLQQLPLDVLTHIPVEQLPRSAMAALALRWIEAERMPRALKLLEPLFADPQAIEDGDEMAFELLLDCYGELDRPRKKQRLIDRVAGCPSRPLRAVALHRRCMLLADEGPGKGMAAAWEVFRQALRECPEHPAHGQLELSLLIAEGQLEQAGQRARFWLAGLQRRGLPADHPLLVFYRDVARDPSLAMLHLAASRHPALGDSHKLLGQMAQRPPAANYRLEAVDGGGGGQRLLVCPALRRIEKGWQKSLWPLPKPAATEMQVDADISVWERESSQRWLGYLAAVPQAFDSLLVLDDLCQAMLQMEGAGSLWIDEQFLLPLLQRAALIVERATQGLPPRRELPWHEVDNRPALRLLGHLAYLRQRRGELSQARELLTRIVRYNPKDNHGFRHELANLLLRAGEDAALLQLALGYPGDLFPELTYGKVLALYRQGDRKAAGAALLGARRLLPRVLDYLVQTRPRKPKLLGDRIVLGGDDQAWLYRQANLDLWRDCGALSWLREQDV